MTSCQIAIKSTYSGKSKFLNDPACDLHLSFGNTILSAHRSHLVECKYILENCNQGKKVYVIEEPLNVNMAKQVLAYFYGFDLCLNDQKELMAFLDVVDFLEVESLRVRIQEIIASQLEKMDLFFILQGSFQYNLKEIWSLCFKELEKDQFEQMNYNRYDLILCDFKLFQIVLRRHHLLKKSEKIVGQNHQNLQQIIRLYCQRYHYNEETIQKMLEAYVYSTGKKINEKDLHTDRTKGQTISYKINTQFMSSKRVQELEEKVEQDSVIKVSVNKPPNTKNSKIIIPLNPSNHKRRRSSFMEEQEEKNVANLIRSGRECIRNGLPFPVSEQEQFFRHSTRKIDSEPKKYFSPQKSKKKIQNKPKTYMQNNLMSGTLSSLENLDYTQEPQSIAGKISHLLEEYNQTLKVHENNFNNMKEYAKSMMMEKNLHKSTNSKDSFNDIFEKTRFTASRNIQNQLFTPQI